MHRCKLWVAGPLIIRGWTPLRPMVSLNLAPLDQVGTTSCFYITLSHSLSLGTLDQPPVLISHFHFHSHLKHWNNITLYSFPSITRIFTFNSQICSFTHIASMMIIGASNSWLFWWWKWWRWWWLRLGFPITDCEMRRMPGRLLLSFELELLMIAAPLLAEDNSQRLNTNTNTNRNIIQQ